VNREIESIQFFQIDEIPFLRRIYIYFYTFYLIVIKSQFIQSKRPFTWFFNSGRNERFLQCHSG